MELISSPNKLIINPFLSLFQLQQLASLLPAHATHHPVADAELTPAVLKDFDPEAQENRECIVTAFTR